MYNYIINKLEIIFYLVLIHIDNDLLNFQLFFIQRYGKVLFIVLFLLVDLGIEKFVDNYSE